MISRRTFTTGLSAALAAKLGTLSAQPAQKRPNILFALADDWSWPDASLAGDRVVKTPIFDSVAKRGVLFTNAYVTSPSCTPSRASILTGQWPWRLAEGMNLAGTLPARFPVYPDLLEEAGYHVGYIGKGWAPGNVGAGGRKRNPAGKEYASYAAFMEARPTGKPFCLWFGCHDPHRPYAIGQGIKAGLDPTKVVVPPYLPDNSMVRSDILDYDFATERYDTDTGKMLADLEAKTELDNTVVVMAGDNGWAFPRCKANLYDRGTHVPLAIMWKGHATPGRVVNDFVSLADLAPTFLDAAGLPTPSEMTGRSLAPILLSAAPDHSRDFVLTGMERHMGARRGDLGYPMRAIRTHDWLYIRNFEPDRWPAGDPNRNPVTTEQLLSGAYVGFADIDGGQSKAYLLMHRDDPKVKPFFDLATGKRPAQELYKLTNNQDPYQLKNLASDPRYKSVLAKFDAELMAQLKETGDLRAVGKGSEYEAFPLLHDPEYKKQHDAFFAD